MPDVQGSVGSTTLNSQGAVIQIVFSALSGTECGYVASEITDEYSRNRYITKKVKYIYYKAILDMETLSAEVTGSHFVKWPPFLPWDKSAMSIHPKIIPWAYCNCLPNVMLLS